jgi:hypothetical protein
MRENPRAETLFALLGVLLSPLPATWRTWFLSRVRLGYAAARQLLEEDGRAFANANRGQMAGGNLVSTVLGVAVATIVGVGVSIPVVNDVINSANLSGLTATIVGFIPVMLGVLIFVATVGPIMAQ